MTWVKLDDNFPDHPKVVGLSVAARWAYVEALCYCARYLTDGALPAAKVKAMTSAKSRAELVGAELWIDCRDGDYAVHDYLAYNPSREQVEKERQERHEDKVRAGQAGAAARWHNGSRPMAEV